MPGLSEHDVFIFVAQLGVIILLAHIFGVIARKLKQPVLVGEVIAGIVLGPSVFGAVLPKLQATIFPVESIHNHLLQGLSWLCVLFLLTITGIEIDVRASLRHAQRSILTSIIGIFLPFVCVFGLTAFLPERFYPQGIDPIYVKLLFSIALAVVAIPVIAKILFDLKMLRSIVGLSIVTAGVLCDIWGWAVLAVIISLIDTGSISLMQIGQTLGIMGAYIVVVITAGRPLVEKMFDWLKVKRDEPTTVLSVLFGLALLNGAICHLLGLHVVLGAFFAGLMAGESPKLTPYIRQSVQDLIFGIFAPIFFVLVGMQLRFDNGGNWGILLGILVVTTAIKIASGFIGSVLSGIGRRNSFCVACGLSTQGTMGIIVALIGVDLGVFNQELFSIVVFVSVVTALLIGPLLKWATKGVQRPLAKYFDADHVFLDVEGKNKEDIIARMAALMAERGIIKDPARIQEAIWSRESEMSTAIGDGIALPHARVPDLAQPILCLFRLKIPIEFDSPDNKPVQILFLELTDINDHGMQLNLIAQVSRFLLSPRNREKLLSVKKAEEIHQALSFDEKA